MKSKLAGTSSAIFRFLGRLTLERWKTLQVGFRGLMVRFVRDFGPRQFFAVGSGIAQVGRRRSPFANWLWLVSRRDGNHALYRDEVRTENVGAGEISAVD